MEDVGAGSSASACEAAQLAIVAGGELPEEIAAHVAACPECTFLRSLSRLVGPTRSSVAERAGGAGWAASALLGRALELGEPLLGRYRLEELRGRGGQGEVYRAVDLDTGDTVALKLVRASGGGASEASNARRVRHENVCRVFHTEPHGELRLIVMEYIDGGALADRMASLTPAQALAMFRDVCRGVHAAHEAGILHLDLKPENVLLRDGHPAVTDFGLSVRLAGDENIVASGGTPRYMAPEQRRRLPVDRRADVYALGRILEDLPGSRRWRRVIERATAEDPERRYPGVGALLAAIDAPARRARRLRRLLAAPVGLCALVGLLPLLLPAPRGARAAWRSHLWGGDTIPAEMWNVARSGASFETPHRLYACGQQPWELFDGKTHYASWEHGVAVAPAPRMGKPPFHCVPLAWSGTCGELRDDDRLCRYREQSGFDVIDHARCTSCNVSFYPISGSPWGDVLDGGGAGVEVPCGRRRRSVGRLPVASEASRACASRTA